jgi:hypothetical protein
MLLLWGRVVKVEAPNLLQLVLKLHDVGEEPITNLLVWDELLIDIFLLILILIVQQLVFSFFQIFQIGSQLIDLLFVIIFKLVIAAHVCFLALFGAHKVWRHWVEVGQDFVGRVAFALIVLLHNFYHFDVSLDDLGSLLRILRLNWIEHGWKLRHSEGIQVSFQLDFVHLDFLSLIGQLSQCQGDIVSFTCLTNAKSSIIMPKELWMLHLLGWLLGYDLRLHPIGWQPQDFLRIQGIFSLKLEDICLEGLREFVLGHLLARSWFIFALIFSIGLGSSSLGRHHLNFDIWYLG